MVTRLRFDETSHKYYLSPTDATDSEREIPGVTTVLGRIYKQDWAIPWATRVCADYASMHWLELSAMTADERHNLIKSAPNITRDKAAAQGTQVHAWAEALINGHSVEIPERYRSSVEHLAQWWQGAKLTPVATETQLWSATDYDAYYGGTLDAMARDTHGRLWLIDHKTGKGIYPEYAYQLAAYAFADNWVVNGNDEPMPPIGVVGALHIRPDGCTFHEVPRAQLSRAHEWWLAALMLYTLGKPSFKQYPPDTYPMLVAGR